MIHVRGDQTGAGRGVGWFSVEMSNLKEVPIRRLGSSPYLGPSRLAVEGVRLDCSVHPEELK
jgi:hypothetical protein